MQTGSRGTFVIPWTQTVTNGVPAASLDRQPTGATWRWTGQAVQMDATQPQMGSDGRKGADDVRLRAAHRLRRLGSDDMRRHGTADLGLSDHCFEVGDGLRSYQMMLIDLPETGAILAMNLGEMPPADQDLTLLRSAVVPGVRPKANTGATICFTPGTQISTAQGPRRVEDLRVGDQVLTRDNGPQAILWLGQRRMSGARLYAMPDLRPIRILAGAFGLDAPDRDLIVSPQHRMLIQGAAAQALFQCPEVLATAADLVDDRRIQLDRSLREVTYVHLLLDQHNIIWANGLLTESFHPADADLDALHPDQRSSLSTLFPQVLADPQAYGDHARRNLTGLEAAILRHELAD